MLRPKTYAWCPDTHQQQCQNAGHCLKEKDSLFLFVKRMPFFFYACVIPFSCQGPLGVSANLIFFFFFFFFFIQFDFFYLFIYLFPTPSQIPFSFFSGTNSMLNRWSCECFLIPDELKLSSISNHSDLKRDKLFLVHLFRFPSSGEGGIILHCYYWLTTSMGFK